MDNLRSKLKTVKGLGSAKAGTHHWLMQRATAILNIILIFFLACTLTKQVPFSYESAVAWIKNPVVAITLIILLCNVLYHAALGFQVVYEDYIHREFVKLAAIYLTKVFLLVTAVCVVFALVYINFKL